MEEDCLSAPEKQAREAPWLRSMSLSQAGVAAGATHSLEATPDAAMETNLPYRNNGNSNGWVKIKLVGTVSNRSAIGAKVRVRATIGGRTFWQMREINTGSGFGAGPLEAHFGLGDATNIDLVLFRIGGQSLLQPLHVMPFQPQNSPHLDGHVMVQEEIHALGSVICSATNKLISSRWSS